MDLSITQTVRENLLNCRVSSISWFELHHGAARSPHPEKAVPRLALLKRLFPFCESFDEPAARRAAGVRVALELMRLNAQPMGPFDVLLAGHALALGAAIVTHNVAKFSRVYSFAIADWQTG